jgi:hypothetical protein
MRVFAWFFSFFLTETGHFFLKHQIKGPHKNARNVTSRRRFALPLVAGADMVQEFAKVYSPVKRPDIEKDRQRWRTG